MKFLPLLWSSLWRKKIRTIFTLLSVFVAFLLFGLLMTIRGAFSFGVDIAGPACFATFLATLRHQGQNAARESRPARSAFIAA